MPCLSFLGEAERDESRPYAGAWQLVLWHKNVKKRSQKRSKKMLQLA